MKRQRGFPHAGRVRLRQLAVHAAVDSSERSERHEFREESSENAPRICRNTF
eukprot:CAMPEP_0206609216 /NCGR_PEP_ID=MMETSP0325_2-20121206/53611_1 /ASSEMBLY_ACC=CAM_ASM_000347 /TAXON_ID=2866 /ORGANISM="Crypthecodinium cohnii, Strain Seligo" /LENGTH=51 /DNA_ID=CAMNT_0054127373 /DNA_START=81 /DNA_END=233 /DNA_ORIENTATION=+